MAVGVITTFPPNTELPPGSTTNGPEVLPPLTYQAAIVNLPQTWTAVQTFKPGSFTLGGLISGALTINAASVAFGILTLPSGSTDFSATGGTSRVVQQTTSGGPFTVAQLSFGDLNITQQVKVSAGDVVAATTDGLVRINKTVGGATNVTLPASSTKTCPIKVVDWKGDADVNNITIILTGPDVLNGGVTTWVIASAGGSAVFSPNSDGSGYSV